MVASTKTIQILKSEMILSESFQGYIHYLYIRLFTPNKIVFCSSFSGRNCHSGVPNVHQMELLEPLRKLETESILFGTSAQGTKIGV